MWDRPGASQDSPGLTKAEVQKVGGPRRRALSRTCLMGDFPLPPSMRPQDLPTCVPTSHPSIRAALSPEKRERAKCNRVLAEAARAQLGGRVAQSLSPRLQKARRRGRKGRAGQGLGPPPAPTPPRQEGAAHPHGAWTQPFLACTHLVLE